MEPTREAPTTFIDVLSVPQLWTHLGAAELTAVRSCSSATRSLHDTSVTSARIALQYRDRGEAALHRMLEALRRLSGRGCRLTHLTLTCQQDSYGRLWSDVLSLPMCAGVTRLELLGMHAVPSRGADAAQPGGAGCKEVAAMLPTLAPCVRELTVQMWRASGAVDVLLAALGTRLEVLELQLCGSSELPCAGLLALAAAAQPAAASGAATADAPEAGASGHRGNQTGVAAAGGLWVRRGAGAAGGRGLRELRIIVSMHRDICLGPFGYGTQARYGGPMAPVGARRGGGGAATAAGMASGARAVTGAQPPPARAATGRAVPPAVAAIAALAPGLRALELAGTRVDRILDPPGRLLGLSALTQLERLRVQLPAAPEPYVTTTGGGGGGSSAGYYGGAGAGGRVNDGGGGGGSWKLGPLLAAMTWIRDLDLGPSYRLPPEALVSLAALTQLTRLRCGSIAAPPPQQYQCLAAAAAAAAAPAAADEPQAAAPAQPASSCAAAGRGAALPLPLPAGVLRLPLPAGLAVLEVSSLPAVPVLAALAALPCLHALRITPLPPAPARTAAAVAAAAAAREAGERRKAAATATAAYTQPAGGHGGRGDTGGGGAGGGSCCDPPGMAALPGGVSGGGDGDGAGRRVWVPARNAQGTVAAAAGQAQTQPAGPAVPDATAATAALPSTAAGAAPEPLRLALVGDEWEHGRHHPAGLQQQQQQAPGGAAGAAGSQPQEVATAARLLRRVLPPSAWCRLSLHPFTRSPARLAGPHAAWMSELWPLAGGGAVGSGGGNGGGGGGVEAVEVAGLDLAAGDLEALVAALPGVRSLGLFMCRLPDGDLARRLQAERPGLALRVDSSCVYDSPPAAALHGGRYGSGHLPYGRGGYGPGANGLYGGALGDGDDDEFVDEAEAKDEDPDKEVAALGGVAWPIAAEMQRAYERALDATDDEEEAEGEEADGGGELADSEMGEAEEDGCGSWDQQG